MELKYPNVAAAYIDLPSKSQTLNSAMIKFLTPKMIMSDQMYPQRVPTEGFFEEMAHLEGEVFFKRFTSINKRLKEKANTSFGSKLLNHYLNILIRRGQFDEVIEIASSTKSDLLDYSTRYIVENARIEQMLAGKKELTLDDYYLLAQTIFSDSNSSIQIKLQVLNRMLVCSCRYKTPLPRSMNPMDCVNIMLDLLVRDKRNTFQSQIEHSVVYRGVAMVSELGINQQTIFLEKALKLAIDVLPEADYQLLIKNENLYTLNQTLYKWALFRDDFKQSENHLNEMVKIDPFDSTAYTEYGLFLFQQKRFEEALEKFNKAIALGPPSVAMNKYFIIQVLQKIEPNSDFITMLNEVLKDDPLSLSPWLDLVEIYKKKKDRHMVHNAVSHILTTPDLKEQLEENEIAYYTSLLA